MWLACMHAVLCIVTVVKCSPTDSGPHNVVAVSGGEVTLHCNRTAFIGHEHYVKWTHIPLGSSAEQDIPRPYRKITTSYGVHELVLEDVQLSDAGIYVCRSDQQDLVEPAGAFLVVIDHQPFCYINYTTANATIDCRVTCAGEMNGNMSLMAEGNNTVLSRTFEVQSVASTYGVQTVVSASAVSVRHSCRIAFYNSRGHTDFATNQPGYVEGRCYLHTAPRPASISARTGTTAGQYEGVITTDDVQPGRSLDDSGSDDGRNKVLIIVMILASIAVIVSTVLVLLAKRGMLSRSCLQSAVYSRCQALLCRCCRDGGKRSDSDSRSEVQLGLHRQVSEAGDDIIQPPSPVNEDRSSSSTTTESTPLQADPV